MDRMARSQGGEHELSLPNHLLFPARPARISLLVPAVSVPPNPLSRFNCQHDQSKMKRFLLFLLASLGIAAIIVTVAMKVSIPLAVDSDFQVLYYTDYGLVRNMNIYDQE